MSRINLYLHGAGGNAQSLLESARALPENAWFTANGLQLAVMTPRADDLLAVPPDSAFLASLDVILEVVSPAGQPLYGVQQDLQHALSPVLSLADEAQSHLVSGYHRIFQESGPRPVRYHYLMYRREDYSRADYMDYYVHHHSRFGLATPLADYYQVYLDIEGGAALAETLGLNAMQADNISELRFDSVEDYLFSDVIREVGPAAGEDEELFVNRAICQSFSMDVVCDTREYGE